MTRHTFTKEVERISQPQIRLTIIELIATLKENEQYYKDNKEKMEAILLGQYPMSNSKTLKLGNLRNLIEQSSTANIVNLFSIIFKYVENPKTMLFLASFLLPGNRAEEQVIKMFIKTYPLQKNKLMKIISELEHEGKSVTDKIKKTIQ